MEDTFLKDDTNANPQLTEIAFCKILIYICHQLHEKKCDIIISKTLRDMEAFNFF